MREDPEAAEEDTEPQEVDLEDAGEDHVVFAHGMAPVAAAEQGMQSGDYDGTQRQDIYPPGALREQALLQFQTQDGGHLAAPEHPGLGGDLAPGHVVPPSAPIRYWYTEFTSSSAGATASSFQHSSIPTG